MFTNPMWFDEVQRIGFIKCSKKAYLVYNFADLFGLLGLLTFVAAFVIPFFTSFKFSLFLLIGSIFFVITRIVLYSWVCAIVERKSFKYDYEKRESQWVEDDQIQVYNYENYKSDSK